MRAYFSKTSSSDCWEQLTNCLVSDKTQVKGPAKTEQKANLATVVQFVGFVRENVVWTSGASKDLPQPHRCVVIRVVKINHNSTKQLSLELQ